MNIYVNRITQIFDKMKTNPDRLEELKNLLMDTLNELTQNNKCLKVYSSRVSNDPYFCMVVPVKYDIIQNTRNIPSDYYIDIDLNSLTRPGYFDGITASEMTAWLLHEICHNIMTSTTKIRMQSILLDNVTKESRDKYARIIKDDISSYFWCDIHSRTYKNIILENNIVHEADRALLTANIYNDWNSALYKYINFLGGDKNRVTDEYTDRMDLAALKMLNAIIRENRTVRDVAYDGDIQMINRLKTYVSQNIQSKLLRHFIHHGEDPVKELELNENNEFKKIDDSLIGLQNKNVLNESVDSTILNYPKILKKVDTLGFELEDIRNTDDKIAVMLELRDLQVEIQTKLKINQHDEGLLELEQRVEDMLIDLKNLKIKDKKYGVWIQGVPLGYEG